MKRYSLPWKNGFFLEELKSENDLEEKIKKLKKELKK